MPLPVEDNATVMIEYEGGVRGLVDVRWHSRVVRDEFRVRGTEGEIDLSPLNGPELVHPGGVERIAAPAESALPLRRGFCQCRRPRHPPAILWRGCAGRRVGDGAGHCLTMVKCSAKYESQAISAAAGMVSTHAHTMLVAMPQRTAFMR